MATKKIASKKKADSKGKSKAAPKKTDDKTKVQAGLKKHSSSSNGHAKSDGIIPPVTTKSITITSVKINKKDELIIGISKIESDGSTTKYPEEHKGRTAHPNLKFALDSLRPHLALLCDYISTQQLKDIKHYSPQQVSNFVVRGISMNGEGYVITGHKIRKDKKVVGLNTPYTLIEEDEKTRYRYMDDLEEKVAYVLKCVEKYQSGEEVGEAKQPEFPFGEAAKESPGTGEENTEVVGDTVTDDYRGRENEDWEEINNP